MDTAKVRTPPESRESTPLVSVVVLNWNGLEDTLECLESLEKCTWDNLDIIVVDNGSTDGSAAALAKTFPGIRLIRSHSNRGYAGGNNLGLQDALARGADFVWILNNDTVVRPDAVGWLVARMLEDVRIGVCGSTLLYFDQPDTVQAYAGASYNPWTTRTQMIGQAVAFDPFRIDHVGVEERLDMVSGAAMFVRREFVEAVGLMCEDYFLFFEELDWVARAGGRFRLAWAPRSVVMHKEGRVSGAHRVASRRSRQADYYSIRSRFLYTRRHVPWALPILWWTLLVVLANRIRRRQVGRIPLLVNAALDGVRAATATNQRPARSDDRWTRDAWR